MTPGVYKCRAMSSGLGETKNGNDQICIELQLYDKEDQPIGALPWYGYFTDASLEISLKALRALGWKGTDVSELDECDCSAVLSQDADAIVREETYEGETKLRVAFINVTGGGVRLAKRLDEKQKKSLADRVKARIIRMDRGAVATPEKQQKAKAKKTGTDNSKAPDFAPETDDSDDIPF